MADKILKEKFHLTSSGTVNYHRTNHRTGTTICEQNIREHLTSHDTVAPDRTDDRTRWSTRHGGRSGDYQRTTVRRYRLTTVVQWQATVPATVPWCVKPYINQKRWRKQESQQQNTRGRPKRHQTTKIHQTLASGRCPEGEFARGNPSPSTPSS